MNKSYDKVVDGVRDDRKAWNDYSGLNEHFEE
jgi:hypothetical protein